MIGNEISVCNRNTLFLDLGLLGFVGFRYTSRFVRLGLLETGHSSEFRTRDCQRPDIKANQSNHEITRCTKFNSHHQRRQQDAIGSTVTINADNKMQ